MSKFVARTFESSKDMNSFIESFNPLYTTVISMNTTYNHRNNTIQYSIIIEVCDKHTESFEEHINTNIQDERFNETV